MKMQISGWWFVSASIEFVIFMPRILINILIYILKIFTVVMYVKLNQANNPHIHSIFSSLLNLILSL
jgi:predicted CDP-diglyceride synthetase/phosphatidate cytidylyltransferase